MCHDISPHGYKMVATAPNVTSPHEVAQAKSKGSYGKNSFLYICAFPGKLFPEAPGSLPFKHYCQNGVTCPSLDEPLAKGTGTAKSNQNLSSEFGTKLPQEQHLIFFFFFKPERTKWLTLKFLNVYLKKTPFSLFVLCPCRIFLIFS